VLDLYNTFERMSVQTRKIARNPSSERIKQHHISNFDFSNEEMVHKKTAVSESKAGIIVPHTEC